uniref:Membrane protein n=1 Tax=Mycobacterium phage BobbyK TaxID=3158892 RepID=A0AAU8GP76_9CAUD
MGRVPRVAARGFGPQAAQFAKLGDAVAQLHASPTGGTVRQVPEGFAFTPLPNNPAPPPGKPVVEPGIQSLLDGRADWCQGCDQCRYRNDMRWLVDAYRCRVCLGPGVGVSALWMSPWHEQPEPEVVAWPWASWRQAGYVALTAALALVFLASALGAFG